MQARVVARRLELGAHSQLRLLRFHANFVALCLGLGELRLEVATRLARLRRHAREPRLHLVHNLLAVFGLRLRLHNLAREPFHALARRLEFGGHGRRAVSKPVAVRTCLRQLRLETADVGASFFRDRAHARLCLLEPRPQVVCDSLAVGGLVLCLGRLPREFVHGLARRLELGGEPRLCLFRLGTDLVAALPRLRQLRREVAARLDRARSLLLESVLELLNASQAVVDLGLRPGSLIRERAHALARRLALAARRIKIGGHPRLRLLGVGANLVELPPHAVPLRLRRRRSPLGLSERVLHGVALALRCGRSLFGVSQRILHDVALALRRRRLPLSRGERGLH